MRGTPAIFTSAPRRAAYSSPVLMPWISLAASFGDTATVTRKLGADAWAASPSLGAVFWPGGEGRVAHGDDQHVFEEDAGSLHVRLVERLRLLVVIPMALIL